MQPETAVCINPFRTSNRQCFLFSDRNPIILIFCISGWLVVPINPDKRRSALQKAPPPRRADITDVILYSSMEILI